MSVETIPDRYRYSVVPHVMVDGASDAIAFYERAFGAAELFRIASPDGTVIHAEITIGESLLMVGDAGGPFGAPDSLGGSSVGLHVYVEDVDALFAQALKAGAEEIQPAQDMFYGDRTAMLKDPYGHVWVLITHLEDLTPDEIVERAQKMFEA